MLFFHPSIWWSVRYFFYWFMLFTKYPQGICLNGTGRITIISTDSINGHIYIGCIIMTFFRQQHVDRIKRERKGRSRSMKLEIFWFALMFVKKFFFSKWALLLVMVVYTGDDLFSFSTEQTLSSSSSLYYLQERPDEKGKKNQIDSND